VKERGCCGWIKFSEKQKGIDERLEAGLRKAVLQSRDKFRNRLALPINNKQEDR